jgi:hypothetical protein
MSSLYQVFVCADDNLLSENTNTTKKNAEVLLQVYKVTGLEVNRDKTKYMSIS